MVTAFGVINFLKIGSEVEDYYKSVFIKMNLLKLIVSINNAGLVSYFRTDYRPSCGYANKSMI